MKKTIFAILSLALLTACNATTPDKFAVYLSDTNAQVFSEDDLLSYNSSNGIFTFTKEGADKMKSFQTSSYIDAGLYQKSFVAKLGDEEIYSGKFWTNLSSMSESGIVMTDVVFVNPEYNTLTVSSGYPSGLNNEQINDARLIQHFKKIDKLIQSGEFTSQISEAVSKDSTISEIENPNLTLPSDVNAGQIKKYFKMDNLLFALVLRNNMNVVLDLPTDFTPTFAGVLVANEGEKAWTVYTHIVDKSDVNKNNPYYLLVDSKKLLLTVVDAGGAGSGEGIMSVFDLSNKNLEGCYYFGLNYNDPTIDGSYYEYSTKFSEQQSEPIESCGGLSLSS